MPQTPGPSTTLEASETLRAIRERRATRSYTEETVGRRMIEELLELASEAPSARNLQPWAFVVFEGRDRIRGFGSEATRSLLDDPDGTLPPEMKAHLSEPGFEMFYGAPLLVVICAASSEPQAAEDCCLAAQNLMLAAHAQGLATCPIGLSRRWLGQPATKERLGIPIDHVPVFPLALGHPAERPLSPGRRAPEISWR
jgi:nitroreductase